MIIAEDARSIYQVSLALLLQGFDTQICRHFNSDDEQKTRFKRWQSIAHDFENPGGKNYYSHRR